MNYKRCLPMMALFLVALLPFLSASGLSSFAQGGNSISGFIFGVDRHPISDINVELLDEFGRTLSRSRSDASGRYAFYRLGGGRFKIRVLPLGTDYQEQEQDVEIVNFTRSTSTGELRTSGFSNEQRDFYLRLRKGITPGSTAALFVQDVPPEAERLFNKGLEQLRDNKQKDAFESIKAALDVFPKYYKALDLLGAEYVKLKYFEAARILFTIAVDVNPRGFSSWYGLGYSLYCLNDFNGALRAVQKAVELNGYSPEALLLLGTLMRQSGNFEDAEKYLVKTKELANDSLPQVYWELALLYGNNLNRFDAAARELRAFLKAQPDSKDAEKIKALIAKFEAKAKPKT
jgi:tetratricopeptide (TPR) repeat protein